MGTVWRVDPLKSSGWIWTVRAGSKSINVGIALLVAASRPGAMRCGCVGALRDVEDAKM